MHPNDKIITFGSNNSVLRKEEIVERVRLQNKDKNKTRLINRPVKIRILEIEWLGEKKEYL